MINIIKNNFGKEYKEISNIMKADKVQTVVSDIEHDSKVEKDLGNDTSIIIESVYINDSLTSFCHDKTKNSVSLEKGMSNTIGRKNTYKNIDFKILEFIKIIGSHKNSADFIVELENNFFISGGTDNKLVVYSPQYEFISQRKFPDSIYNISETCETKMKKDEINLIATSNERTYLINLDYKRNKLYIYLEIKGCSLCVEFKDDNYIICSNNQVYHLLSLFSKIIEDKKEIKIFEKPYRGGIKLNSYLVALTSNRVIPQGEDSLLIYDKIIKRVVHTIKGYSFVFSSNGLLKIKNNDKKDKEENIRFLCACKKYLKGQNNGILLVNFAPGKGINSKKQSKHIFYKTGSFEVYCFLQIFIKDELNNRFLDDKMSAIDTNYILVGGSEQKKNKGMIKLFKIINNQELCDTKLEFIQNIDIKTKNGFKGFRGPISSMIQSKKNGRLLVTCWDGNIYLFKPPNLDYFLFYDEKNKNNQ